MERRQSGSDVSWRPTMTVRVGQEVGWVGREVGGVGQKVVGVGEEVGSPGGAVAMLSGQIEPAVQVYYEMISDGTCE